MIEKRSCSLSSSSSLVFSLSLLYVFSHATVWSYMSHSFSVLSPGSYLHYIQILNPTPTATHHKMMKEPWQKCWWHRFWPPLHVQISLFVCQDMLFLAMMHGSRDCNVSWSIALVQTDTWIAIKFDPGIQCCPDTESPLAPSSIPLISSSTFMMLTLGFQWNVLTTRR